MDGKIYIDKESADLLAKVLRDIMDVVPVNLNNPVDIGYRRGIEAAAQTIERIGSECGFANENLGKNLGNG